ncbi:MAG TPA: IS1380 family transposase [Solirubrobacteraceae bacterium]|nr:IS1380 family transposase [Solirubrobacteraceae bacterium]
MRGLEITIQEDTQLVKPKARLGTVEVTADGEGLVSHAGIALLAELADRSGLTGALSEALAVTRERRSANDPGQMLVDVAVMLADGGDCVTDLDAYRGQERLFGARASETTTHRVLKSIDEQLLGAMRAARAQARARVWDAGARPETLTFNIDATLLTAHSEKERAAGNYKHGYGFHPLGCWLDETGEPLAAILRPGNAGSNTAEDHFTVLGMALAQIPAQDLEREMLVRTDIGGCTHAFTADCREAGIRFSVGYELTDTVRQAILDTPEARWVQAINADGEERDGAWVTELIDGVDLSAWPEGSRLICRRERPHPGAQFQIFDEHGYRHTCFITDQHGTDIAALELRHRGRARVEDSIRAGKDTGMRNLPHHAFAHNQTWLELSLIAQDLLCWIKLVCLQGELTKAEPKRLRHCLLHTAGKVVRHGRRTQLKLDRDWPWSAALAAAFARLRATPQLC